MKGGTTSPVSSSTTFHALALALRSFKVGQSLIDSFDLASTLRGNGAGDLNPRRRWGIEPLRRLGVFGGFPACP
jgi:hypothetical protein